MSATMGSTPKTFEPSVSCCVCALGGVAGLGGDGCVASGRVSAGAGGDT
jgi:hypothetical protein